MKSVKIFVYYNFNSKMKILILIKKNVSHITCITKIIKNNINK